jgi:uncharacterized protein YbjT (DUF2867 family)
MPWSWVAPRSFSIKNMEKKSKLVLVTGATGYVATRLIPALLARGYRVRCLARAPQKLRNRPWLKDIEVVKGDVLDAKSLQSAMAGIHTAFYLVHNMSSGESYREKELLGARNFGDSAHTEGVQRIIYLGGLGGSSQNRHMHSRQEAGRMLRQSGVPVVELRASVVIGSGSISFEMIRYLTSWFPFIPAPSKTNHPGQPIGIKDLLNVLIAALEVNDISGRIFEIGGPQAISYPDLMVEYARQQILQRSKISLPFYSVTLSAIFADWLTPVPFAIAHPLMEELTAPSVVTSHNGVIELLGEIELSTYALSVRNAIARDEYLPNFPWISSLVTRKPLVEPHVITCGEGLLIDHRETYIESAPRSLMDVLIGNIKNDWDVEEIEKGVWIRLQKKNTPHGCLRIEYKLEAGLFTQTSLYEPFGLPGLLWWYIFLPLHKNKFKGMFERLIHI